MEIGLIVGGFVFIVLQVFVIVKMSALIAANRKLNESQQILSDQMTDLEEQTLEIQNDVRKLTQHFVNFAKGVSGGANKNWWKE